MVLEQEQGYLQVDRWYYDYTEDKLIDLMKRYPYIPFNIDDGGSESYYTYYRWNSELNIIECINASIQRLGCWEKGNLELKSFVGYKNHYCFIIFREALTSFLYQGSDNLEIIINSKHHELIHRNMGVSC